MKSDVLALVAFLALALALPTPASAKKAEFSVAKAHAQALDKALGGNVKGAIRDLKSSLPKAKTQVEKDRLLISLGRLQYEQKQWSEAIASFDAVSREGNDWLNATEEAAWAEFRRDKPEATIARLKTVTSPAFKDATYSEPFFLMGLAQLRVCDFKSLFKTIDSFKTRFAPEVKKLEASNAPSDKSRLKEIGETVQKLNLVEAEAIQLLYLDENGQKRKGSPATIAKDSDQLSFPHEDSDEFWLDEVDGFRVTLKGCLRPERTDVAATSSSKKKVTQ